MDNSQINKVRDRVAVLAGAVLALLSGFGVISWDAAQTALVVAAVASGIMFGGSLVAHFKKNTETEWAAVAMSLVAFLGSGLAALNAVHVTSLTEQQIELVIGVVVAVFGLGGIPVVRARTYPIDKVAAPGGSGDPVNPTI